MHINSWEEQRISKYISRCRN